MFDSWRSMVLKGGLFLALLVLLAQSAFSQTKKPPLGGFGNKGTGGVFGGALAGDDDVGDKVTASATFTKPDANGRATLSITAEISPGWHIYSITQPSGGTVRTKLKFDQKGFRVVGDFTPSPLPKIEKSPSYTVPLEEHFGTVTWSAPIQFDPGVAAETFEFKGSVYAQVCKESCLIPKDYPFVAKMLIATGQLATEGESHVAITGRIEPQEVAPGSTARLFLTATPEPGWHIYALDDKVPAVGNKPTIIALTSVPKWSMTAPVEDAKPIVTKGPDGETVRYHEKTVTWSVDLHVPKDTTPGEYSIAGLIGFQVCSDKNCEIPKAARFSAFVPVRTANNPGELPLSLVSAKSYAFVADSLPTPQLPLWQALLFALLGGAILNLMPCVLPVIGLKLYTFIDQSGHSRGRIFALNLWYTAGLLCVFMVLATLASAAKLGLGKENLVWGEHFNSIPFAVTMAGIVFVCALSFLGVWEIPIPGFVGSGKATEYAAKEGAMGAFAKGVFSTVLATPCSGPFLGPVFTFTLSQTTPIIFAIFAAIGIGMASPYLAVGAFPGLIRWLPRPGAWMDTFKQIMGFVLLGTVVFIFTYLKHDYFIAAFTLLIGLWFGCWWIGRTPLTAGLGDKIRAWGMGSALAGIIGVLAFIFLTPDKQLIPWQPFTAERLAALKKEGKTVMVDFTADWCLTCKANLKWSINRQEVLDRIMVNGVIPLLADLNGSPDVKAELAGTLNSSSIPVLAIYPADSPDTPIILRDVITKKDVLEALDKAGKSKPSTALSQPSGTEAALNEPSPPRE